ncbi:MAG TPA: hypothetical protein VFT49_03590 [Candidatus Saccharimonadales bacterium]|nr:hypothetical protein [Candidatus Saccharimonadales bacterium]
MPTKKLTAKVRFFHAITPKKLVKPLALFTLAIAAVAAIATLGIITEPSASKKNDAQTTPKPVTPLCFRGVSLNIVAHEDDDILFMNPDIQQDIYDGRCVTTVFVASGDPGLGLDYIKSREAGARAAYAFMSGEPNKWIESTRLYDGRSIETYSLDNYPKIRLMFMRLPNSDGGADGFSLYSNQTLERLRQDKISQVEAADGTATYTSSDLVATLASIIQKVHPDTVRTQDFTIAFGNTAGDHSDHLAVADYTIDANELVSYPHVLIGYKDYPIASFPVNLAPAQIKRKESIWFAYSPNDKEVCDTIEMCKDTKGNTYYQWFYREYTVGTIPSYYSVGVPANVPASIR